MLAFKRGKDAKPDSRGASLVECSSSLTFVFNPLLHYITPQKNHVFGNIMENGAFAFLEQNKQFTSFIAVYKGSQ